VDNVQEMILMKLEKEIEDKLLQYIKKVFVNDKWDYLHSIACVNTMKKIIAVEGGDEKVLLTTMYLHDIGYAGSLKKGYSLNDRIEAKSRHMARSVEKAKPLLEKLGYSDSEIKQIIGLISVHDKLDELTLNEELLVLEADSLGAIDPNVNGNRFGEKEYERYVEIFERKRVPKFFTKTGKEILKEFACENELFQKYTKLFKK